MRTRVAFTILALALATSVSAHPDAWLTMKTKMALLTAQDVDGTQINVDTVRDVVTLQGNVETKAEATRAAEIARGIEGVRDVRNVIQVVPERREEAVAASDTRIRKRVKAELRSNAELDDSTIHVQSANAGVVVIGGEATTLSDHLLALQLARRTSGVRRVVSEVRSPDRIADEELWKSRRDTEPKRASRMKDAWVTSEVKLRLLANDRTPAGTINVDTWNGVTTLFGTVPGEGAKEEAVMEARKVDGVKDVVDQLQVVPEERAEAVEMKDEEIAKAVEAALETESALRGADIDVEVKDRVVRLTGTVDSFDVRLRAAIVARQVKGVRSVHEELRVVPEERAS